MPRQKLQPFFPPLEPLQSLNLRAALYRALDTLKKNGVLGRDITLRKTMLDECKGEKFEEVLVVFSTIVLKKQVLNERRCAGSIVRGLVLEHSMPANQQQSILPLAIAHRASLATHLQRKRQLRSFYSEFGRLLDLKEQELAEGARQLREAAQDQSEERIPKDAARAGKEQLKIHWVGDTRWVDAIMEGHPKSTDDSLLDTPFDRVWSNVQNGTVASAKAASDRTLLEDLEIRVAGQQARLGRWKKFQEDMKKKAASRVNPQKADANPEQKRGIDLGFRRHQDLVPKFKSIQGAQSTQEAARNSAVNAIAPDYQKLITSMQEELANVGKSKTRSDEGWRGEPRQEHLTPENGVDEVNKPRVSEGVLGHGSPRSKDDGSLEERPSSSVASKIPTMTRGVHSRTTIATNFEKTDTPHEIHEVSPPQDPLTLLSRGTSPEQLESKNTDACQAESRMLAPGLVHRQYHNDQLSPRKDEDELLAEQIVSSVANAEASPVEPKLSLADRTRRSMAYKHHKDPLAMEPPPIHPPPIPESYFLPSPDTEAFDSRATLLERTRQSISLLPAIKARKSIHKPRHSKIFPTNQFETPKKQYPGINKDTKDLTPPEELFGQDVDCASVFKSRPKIAVSPTLSPSRLEDLASGMEDMELAEDWDSSPLVRTVGKIGGV